MKKISRLLILLLVAFIPFAVKADMGAPMVKPYKVTVISSSGLDYTIGHYDTVQRKYVEEKKHFNQGDTFYITYEEGDPYSGSLSEDGTDLISINASDKGKYKPVDSEYVPNDSEVSKYGKVENSYKTAETLKEVELRKGPADAYEVITKIPAGTKLSYKYGIGDSGIVYIYVDYNGQKGWINVLEKSVLLEFNKKVVIFKDINTSCGVLSAGTVFTTKYQTDDWSHSVLYESNGCRALVSDFKSDDVITVWEESKNKYTFKKDVVMYSKPDNKGDKITTLKKGTQFKIIASTPYEGYPVDMYIDANGTTGFVHVGDNYESIVDEKNVTQPDETTTTEETTTEETTTEETTEVANSDEPTNSKTNVNKTRNIIIISVIVGVALAVTAIVIIILVNKKKKDVPTDEVKPVETEAVMTSNDLNIVQENVEEQPTEEVKDETEENKEDAE